MSLDQNLFTLHLTPNTSDPSGLVTDLTDPSGNVHYRKRRIPGQVYKIEVYDPISESLLASATSPSVTSKHKTIELYNPSKVIELKYTGTLTFRWFFKWEEHEFEWKREECFMIRKPDPPVMVAVTKEPPGRIKTASVQILDYNLNRFDIDDRKGLEIVILTALLTFQDVSDSYHESPNESNTTSLPAATTSALKSFTEKTARKVSGGPTCSPPVVPPKPKPKIGVERVAEIQASRGQVNEVTIIDECSPKDYAQYCARMLRDEAMLFISIRSSDGLQAPKVLQVVEETKRIRHKAGDHLGDQDLYQYVLYDTVQIPRKGPKTINLDDNKDKAKGKDYTPPSNIVVHLSKIDMPELRPRSTVPIHPGEGRSGASKERTKDGKSKDTRKDKEKKVKESSDKERNERKKRETEHATAERAKLRSKSSAPALASPHFSSHPASTSQRPHVHPHQTHLHKSSPSQLGRPANHSAPPLPPRMPMHRVAPPPNRYSTYGTYPVSYHVRYSSSPQRLEPPVSPPSPSPSPATLLARLLGR
ncbi:hypothetical protein DFJ58DRAFT_660192 [Suillus subalutaceus]|uniref:uncharacterized protein n=1 Tax=Suillus subalutaceus TaxID=48586 RepID=UPI001B886221|nr:uncharacterized protein DFJ58DRAFT_660192 [Suillus subalutaceus]KAG1854833.1 hypothetical protein DFJ58DRAFT_660192 [Suillus subalutaceus]